ncbi:hypothetical protein PENSPDRAFT_115332 [Peniophora sp. CONT]|nr:hypothetical protein PENSPDRAFT_115332 [Peniophora sp. CONT]
MPPAFCYGRSYGAHVHLSVDDPPRIQSPLVSLSYCIARPETTSGPGGQYGRDIHIAQVAACTLLCPIRISASCFLRRRLICTFKNHRDYEELRYSNTRMIDEYPPWSGSGIFELCCHISVVPETNTRLLELTWCAQTSRRRCSKKILPT